MDFSKFLNFFVQTAVACGIISKDQGQQFQDQMGGLFEQPEDDPNAGTDTVNFSQSFDAAAGEDKQLELEEFKYQLQNKWDTKLQEKLEPLKQIFVKKDGSVDEELFKQVAGADGKISAEELAKIDKNSDGKITADEIAAYKNTTKADNSDNTNNNNGINTGGNNDPDTTDGINPGGNDNTGDVDKTPGTGGTEGTGNNSEIKNDKTPEELLQAAKTNATNDTAVKAAVGQIEKINELYGNLSVTMQNSSTVKAAMANVQQFGNLYTKLLQAKTQEEVTRITEQIKALTASVTSAQKVIAQAVKDDARTAYADANNTDVNSVLTRNAGLNSDYQNNVCRTLGGEIKRGKGGQFETSVVKQFTQMATKDLESYAVSLRKELKEQMGENYNKDEVDAYIEAAIQKTIKSFTTGQVQAVGHKDKGKGAVDQNRLVFNDYGKGKDWHGNYEYSVKSLIDSFMTNFKAEVENTPTKQADDIKANAETKYTENSSKNEMFQRLQYGGMIMDQNGSPIRDKNGNTLDITKYMSDNQKKELDESLKKLEEKQKTVDDLMAKMRKATTAEEAKDYQTQLNSAYQEMNTIQSTLQRYLGDAYYRFRSENSNSYGGGYSYGYDNQTPAQEYGLYY